MQATPRFLVAQGLTGLGLLEPLLDFGEKVEPLHAFGISRNQPFRDGNKRIAFLAAVIFLGLNGLDFVAPEEEVVKKMFALASGELDEQEVAEWLRCRSQPPPG